ncbi:MAG: hypothetical protein ACRDOE_02800 [Streptosporangiaceae bacterium]
MAHEVRRKTALLLEEISNTPPRMPGDTRPITYQLTGGNPRI